jgi:hypothetical protein
MLDMSATQQLFPWNVNLSRTIQTVKQERRWPAGQLLRVQWPEQTTNSGYIMHNCIFEKRKQRIQMQFRIHVFFHQHLHKPEKTNQTNLMQHCYGSDGY